MSTDLDHWTSMPSPNIQGSVSNLVAIDGQRFMVAKQTNYKRLQTKYECHVYNTHSETWTKICEINGSGRKALDYIGHDAASNRILLAVCREIKVFHISTKAVYAYDLESTVSKFICIDDECHIIGLERGDHRVLGNENKTSQHLHTFTENHDGLREFGLIYVSTQGRRGEFLLFGGQRWSTFACVDTVYKYSLWKDKWLKLDIKLPQKLNSFGYAISKDERYIFIMGGWRDDLSPSNNVIILDLHTMEFFASPLSLPFKGHCRAVVMEDSIKVHDLLVHEFIRKQLNLHRVDLPLELIKMIGHWYYREYVHVMSEGGEHWKIDADRITENATRF